MKRTLNKLNSITAENELAKKEYFSKEQSKKIKDARSSRKNKNLVELERKLEFLMINTTESFACIDINFRLIAFNKQFQKLCAEYYGEAIKDECILDLWKSNNNEELKNAFWNAHNGKQMELKMKVSLADNSSHVFLHKFKPAYGEKENIIGAFVSTKDITDRICERTKLNQSEEKYRSLIEHSIYAVILARPDGVILEANQATIDMFGYNLEELQQIGRQGIIDHSPPNIKDLIKKREQEGKLKGELIGIRKNGERFPCEFSSVIYKDTYGENRTSTTIIDISERKKAEKKLEKRGHELSEIKNKLEYHRLRLIQAQAIAHVGNWELDFETNTSVWSEEVCRIYGLSPEENLHSFESWMSFVHPEDLYFVKKEIKKSKTSLSDLSFSCRIIRRDGVIRDVYSESKFEFNQAGKPIGMYGIMQDLTERKKQEKERELLIKELSQNNKDLRQFSFITSHNLRGPIATLLGLTSLVEKMNIKDEALKQIVNGIKKVAITFDNTVKDLTNVLMIKENPSVSQEKLNVSEIFGQIAAQTKMSIEKNDAQIETNFSEAAVITFNRLYMENIFLNLLTNAIKYKSPLRKLKIIVSTKQVGDSVLLVFEDNGMGLDVELNKDKVFGLYQKFHNHPDSKGLGLFMIKSQMESLGLRIDIESQVNVGTKFILQFNK